MTHLPIYTIKNAVNHAIYKNEWESYGGIFYDEFLLDKEKIILENGYHIDVVNYRGDLHDRHLNASFCTLYHHDDYINEWYSIDNKATFYKIIHHKNGNDYLIFRQDLYGFSVLDLTAKNICQFYPDEAILGNESFIWVGINHHKEHDLLAVSGCCWACPYQVFVFDFTNPLSDTFNYINSYEYFQKMDYYDDVDFDKWHDDGDLSLTIYDENGKELNHVIDSDLMIKNFLNL